MGYAELIAQKLASLSPEKQAEVFDFVEFVAARAACPTQGNLREVMLSARGSLHSPMNHEQLDREIAGLRSEWGRGA